MTRLLPTRAVHKAFLRGLPYGSAVRGLRHHLWTESQQLMPQPWQSRSLDRIPDALWISTVHRVRSEFEEMPCLRVTPRQACVLFGLSDTLSAWVLDSLARDGFLERARTGEYQRRNATP